MRAGNRERTALRRRRGGALSFESAALLVLVASMAVAGLFSLGGAMDRAIGGGARPAGFVAAPHDVPRRTAPLAAQAGIASAMDEAAEFARRASRGTGEVAPPTSGRVDSVVRADTARTPASLASPAR